MNISFEGFSKKERSEFDAAERLHPVNRDVKVRPGKAGSTEKSSFLESVSRGHHKLLKIQMTVSGLENLAQQLRSGQTVAENEKYLHNLLDNTKLHDERVLTDYEDTLRTIVKNNDLDRLGLLIDEQRHTLSGLTTNDTIAQNIISAQYTAKNTEFDVLLQKVITTIKNNGAPLFNLSREKVIDLLR